MSKYNDGEDVETSRANQARHIAEGEGELLRIQDELQAEIERARGEQGKQDERSIQTQHRNA